MSGDPPRILALGVTRGDIRRAEDIFEERLLEIAAGAGEPAAEDARPKRRGLAETYVEGEEWGPNDVDCWHCTADFETPPFFIPLYIKVLGDGRRKMGVLGNFCSANCAAGHIGQHYGPSSSLSHKETPLINNLHFLVFLRTGARVDHIAAAPHYTERERFGGPLDDRAFARRMGELGNGATHRGYEITVVPDRLRGASGWEIAGVARAPPRPPTPVRTPPAEAETEEPGAAATLGGGDELESLDSLFGDLGDVELFGAAPDRAKSHERKTAKKKTQAILDALGTIELGDLDSPSGGVPEDVLDLGELDLGGLAP